MPIRRAALAALMLTACATPSGATVDECNTSWRGLDPQIVTVPEGETQSIPIACISPVDDRRVSIGFELPSGPECYALAGVELEESAAAAAVTLTVSPVDRGGACPEEPVRTVTEVDLQSPVGDRTLLDGSR